MPGPDIPPVPESPSFLTVTQEAAAAFQRDGAVCIRQAFPASLIENIRKGIDENMINPSQYAEYLKGAGGDGRFFNDYCNWQRIPAFRDIVYNTKAAEMAAVLMGSTTTTFYHEHVLVKEAGASKATPWHHDQSYYPVDGNQLCSFWIPVDPVPLETSLQFVRGSHHLGWFIPRMFADSVPYDKARSVEMPGGSRPLSEYKQVPDVESQRRSLEFLSWALEPGDFIAFQGRTLHASAGNSTSTPRRVLSLRWAGDDARFAARPWLVSPPVSGGLSPGDPLACQTFPLIFKGESGALKAGCNG